MKLNKLVLPLALPLIVVLATAGCSHKYNGKVTNLPTHEAAETGGAGAGAGGGGQDLNTRPFNSGDAPSSGIATSQPYAGGPIGTAATWDPANFNIDKTKLAAYTVHFKFDSATVEDNEQANITSVSQALTSDPSAKLLIEGHCDERGTEEYNRSLGERRALALREALAKDGVDPERIRTISYGKDQPVDPGHDENAWKQNRRGQFDLCTPKTPVQ